MGRSTKQPALPARYSTILLLVALAVCLSPPPAEAQNSGSFQGQFPDAYQLLETVEAVENALLHTLVNDLQNDPTRLSYEASVAQMAARPGGAMEMQMGMGMAVPVGPRERTASQDLLNRIQARSTGGMAPPISGDEGRRFTAIMSRTHDLRGRLLDIFADSRITDKEAAVAAALDGYSGEQEEAMLLRPADYRYMYVPAHAGTFRDGYTLLRSVLWAGQWLEFAVFEPLFLTDTQEERRAAMQVVMDRFFAKLADVPAASPSELPRAPTIAPALFSASRPAAAALDNTNMLYQLVSDGLLSPEVSDKGAATEEAIALFTDAMTTVSDYDWVLFANRTGIFNQGGPAVGTLEQSERNQSHMHAGMTIPGMPGG